MGDGEMDEENSGVGEREKVGRRVRGRVGGWGDKGRRRN